MALFRSGGRGRIVDPRRTKKQDLNSPARSAAAARPPSVFAVVGSLPSAGPAPAGAVELLETRTLLSTYYVSPAGSDSADGTSLSAPFKTIQQAEPGSKWAIGTELNLVKRLAHDHPDLEVVFLEQHVGYCATMNRIDLPHLVWALEDLAQGHVVNQITVDPETERYAKAALQRMLDLPGETARD